MPYKTRITKVITVYSGFGFQIACISLMNSVLWAKSINFSTRLVEGKKKRAHITKCYSKLAKVGFGRKIGIPTFGHDYILASNQAGP
jgi:hypothetical protein